MYLVYTSLLVITLHFIYIEGKIYALNHQKVSKNYKHDQFRNVILLFMSFLKTLIRKRTLNHLAKLAK